MFVELVWFQAKKKKFLEEVRCEENGVS